MTPLIWTTRRAKPHSDIKSEAAAQQPDLARAGRLKTVCIEEWDSTTFQSIAASVETLLDDPEAKLQETVHTIKEAMVDIARQAGKPRTQYQTKNSGLHTLMIIGIIICHQAEELGYLLSSCWEKGWCMEHSMRRTVTYMDADERQKLWFTPAGEDSEFAEGMREMEGLGKVHNMFRWTDEMMRATKVWKEGDNEDEWNLHDPRMVEGDDGKWEMALPRCSVRQPEPATNLYLRDLRLRPFWARHRSDGRTEVEYPDGGSFYAEVDNQTIFCLVEYLVVEDDTPEDV